MSFKVLTDSLILIARILKLLNSVQFFMPTRQTVMLERRMINNKRLNVFLNCDRNVRRWNNKFSNMIKFRSMKFCIRTKLHLTSV